MTDAGSIKATIDFDATGLEAAVNRAMSKATKHIDGSIDTAMNRAESRMRSGFRKMGGVFLAAFSIEAISNKVVQAAGYITTLGQKTEKTLNTFQSVTRATGAEMQRVSAKAKQLGNDISIPGASAADAAEAMTELAKGGLSVEESMSAAQGTLRLAAAAQIEGSEAAEIQAAALNAFGLAANKANMVADVLANGANASAAEITDMSQALGQAAAVANAAGLSIQETTTFLAQFANAGIKGSDAGTLLKTMLMRLSAPTGVAAKEMQKLGLNVYDSSGRMVSAEEITKRLISATEGMTEADRAAALQKIFGADAIRGVNVLLDQGIKGHRETAKAMEQQGSAARVAAARSKGLGGAISGLVSIAESLAIEIYDNVAPAFDSWLRGGMEQLPGVIEDAAAYVTALLDALEPAADIVAAFIEAAKPGAIIAFKAALAGLLGTMRILGAVLGPVADLIEAHEGAFQAVVGPLVAATIAYKAFSAAASGIRTIRTNAITGMTNQVNRLKTSMTGATGAVSRFRVVSGGMVGALGGPWGLALGAATIAIGYFAQKSAEARAKVDGLKQSLNAQTGALTKNSREWAAKALRESGALEAAVKLGIKLPMLTDAVMGEKNAVAQVNRVLDGFKAKTSQADSENRSFSAGLGVGSAALGEEAVAAGKVRNVLTELSGTVKQATREKKLEIRATRDSKTAKDADRRATQQLSGMEAKLKGDVYATNRSLREQKRDADSTKAAILGLKNATIKGINSQIDFEQASDDLRKQIKSLTPEVRQNGKALDVSTQAGRDTMRSFVALATASAGVEGGMAKAKAQIYQAARSLGASKPEARALTRQFISLRGAANRVPNNVTVRTSAPGATQALAQLNALHAKAAAIDGMSVQTYTYEKRILQTLRRATGGPVFGPGTGTSDSIPARLSNGEHVWTAAEVDAAGGHGNVMRLRNAVLSGAVAFARGGGLDKGRVVRSQPTLRAREVMSDEVAALVDTLQVSVGDKGDLPEALDETLFHLRRIRRGGRYAAV